MILESGRQRASFWLPFSNIKQFLKKSREFLKKNGKKRKKRVFNP
jgi:hypothetical protein